MLLNGVVASLVRAWNFGKWSSVWPFTMRFSGQLQHCKWSSAGEPGTAQNSHDRKKDSSTWENPKPTPVPVTVPPVPGPSSAAETEHLPLGPRRKGWWDNSPVGHKTSPKGTVFLDLFKVIFYFPTRTTAHRWPCTFLIVQISLHALNRWFTMRYTSPWPC